MGMIAASHGPTYGTNLNAADNSPQQRGIGHTQYQESGSNHQPMKSIDDRLCQQVAAHAAGGSSPRAWVVILTCPGPIKRITRSRRSSRLSSMKITRTITMPATPRGPSTGPMALRRELHRTNRRVHDFDLGHLA